MENRCYLYTSQLQGFQVVYLFSGCLKTWKPWLFVRKQNTFVFPPFHTNRYGSNASETLMDNKTLVGYLQTMVGYVYLKNPDTNKVN